MKLFYLLFMFVWISGAQQPVGTTKPAVPAKPNAAATPLRAKPQGITLDGVMEMALAGLSEDLIITSLRKESKAFDLSTADMIRLKRANLSDNVLKIMLDPKAVLPTPTPATTPLPQPIPAPVIVQTTVVLGNLILWSDRVGSRAFGVS